MNKEVFFTADQHFGHTGVIEYTDRKFKQVEAMDNYMIWAWNEVVGKQDVVYVLGDFIWRGGEYAEYILNQLHGNIYLLKGDHDRAMGHKKVTLLNQIHEMRHEGDVLILCHWPFRNWRRQHFGAINLHGHSHCRGTEAHNQLDVGVDGHNYLPWTLKEIKTFFLSLDSVEPDRGETIEGGMEVICI